MKPRVLIIEDDVDIRDGLAEFLDEEEGFSVSVADNGKAALELLRDGLRPDVLLLDLMMPVMDGAAFRAVQSQDPALAHMPIVVLSADGRLNDVARQLGLTMVTRKPFDPFELAALLRLAIERSATDRDLKQSA